MNDNLRSVMDDMCLLYNTWAQSVRQCRENPPHIDKAILMTISKLEKLNKQELANDIRINCNKSIRIPQYIEDCVRKVKNQSI